MWYVMLHLFVTDVVWVYEFMTLMFWKGTRSFMVVYMLAVVSFVVCFVFECKYIRTVNTYQSFGVHLFSTVSTVLVHVIFLYIENMLEPRSLLRFQSFFMIGFSTLTINQIKGSNALISTYWKTRNSVFSRLQLARVPRGTDWMGNLRYVWKTRFLIF